MTKLLHRTPKNKKPKFQKEPIWKIILNDESKKSLWEIVHLENEKSVRLHYVPEENYSEKDVNINLTYEEFEDLIRFMKSMDSKYY